MSEEIKQENQESNIPSVVYQIDAGFKKDLEIYLNTRPFNEVDWFLTQMFELENQSPYYTEEGIKALFKYLGTCPRKEVKNLLERVKTEVHQYTLDIEQKEG